DEEREEHRVDGRDMRGRPGGERSVRITEGAGFGERAGDVEDFVSRAEMRGGVETRHGEESSCKEKERGPRGLRAFFYSDSDHVRFIRQTASSCAPWLWLSPRRDSWARPSFRETRSGAPIRPRLHRQPIETPPRSISKA